MTTSVGRAPSTTQAVCAAWVVLLAVAAPGIAQEAGEQAVPPLIDAQGHTEEEQALLTGCDQRIREHRMADLTVMVLSANNQPVPEADVHVEQVRHAFLFGCNVFALDAYRDDAQNRGYAERFAALLNYATLPFYWAGYEPEPGQTGEARVRAMAQWCAQHGIATKGHPLVWHETAPDWLPLDQAGLLGLMEARVKSIVSGFAGLVDRWDVINEATVSANVDNPVGHWVRDVGATAAVAQSLAWAREAGPRAQLVVNDFNIEGDAYPQLLGELNARSAPYDAVGIQSHMHPGTRPLTDWWRICERYQAFGKPLHFTEMTVLSGPVKTNSDWHGYRDGWDTTPEGEKLQAEYVTNLYRLLFSHPAVQAITWWDFSDAGAWQGAPAGLVRQDMTPKPVYEQLLKLIKDEWWTDETPRTNAQGQVTLCAFLGEYRVVVTRGGKRAEVQAELRPGRPNEWRLRL